MWGDEGWKNIVICVVSDGRALVNHRSLALLAALGVYQDGIALDHGEGVETGSQRPATAHIYEVSCFFSIFVRSIPGINSTSSSA